MSLKKNLVIEKNGLIYFFDESRFGTHSKIGHGWFKTGERTGVKIKLGFKNFYLYSAVNPISGDNFTLRMPKVNTECMNVFLAEFSKEIGEARATIIMDGASWHKSKDLMIPNNITITILPPYCPELNPVERLWLYRVFTNTSGEHGPFGGSGVSTNKAVHEALIKALNG